MYQTRRPQYHCRVWVYEELNRKYKMMFVKTEHCIEPIRFLEKIFHFSGYFPMITFIHPCINHTYPRFWVRRFGKNSVCEWYDKIWKIK